MAGTPSHIRAASGGTKQIITDLGLLNEKTMPKFVEKYADLASANYIVMKEAQGASKRAVNNKISYWTPKGKDVPSVKSSGATVTGGSAGADITITVASAYHTGGVSPLAPGHYYYNDTSGQVYQVISVNSTAPTANTAVLRITTNEVAVVAATDLLIFDVTIVGEASDTQETILNVDEKVSHYMATIKTSKKFTDWSLMEETDIKGLFKPRQMAAEYKLFLYQQERLLMFNKPFTNVGMSVANSHTGLIPLVQQFGQSDVASTAINEAYFTKRARMIDAEGYAKEYDNLCNLNFRIKYEAYIASAYPNGAIQYNTNGSGGPMEVARNFTSYSINGIKDNLITYDHFSSAKMAGAAIDSGLFNNACLSIPVGSGVTPDGDNVPRFAIRWNQAEGSDSPIRVRTTGGLAPQPTDDKEHLIISHVAHKGIQPFGLQGFLWTKLA